jgi:hypothetical protein
VKKVLILGTVLGTGLFAISLGAALGVVLGSRALVVSAEAVQPIAALHVAPSHLANGPVLVASRDHAAPAAQ